MKKIVGILVVSSLIFSCQEQKKTQNREVIDEVKIENPTNDHLLTLELQDLELSVHKTEGNIVHLDDHKE